MPDRPSKRSPRHWPARDAKAASRSAHRRRSCHARRIDIDDPSSTPTPGRLPPREPRPFAVHWAVDSAIAFLVVVVPALLLGAPIAAVVALSVLIGLAAAPTTQRREAEGLAARRRRDDDATGGDPAC